MSAASSAGWCTRRPKLRREASKVGKPIKSVLGENAEAMAIRTTAKKLRVMGMKRPLGPILFDDLGLKPAVGWTIPRSAWTWRLTMLEALLRITAGLRTGCPVSGFPFFSAAASIVQFNSSPQEARPERPDNPL
jgi:hypothetical protein